MKLRLRSDLDIMTRKIPLHHRWLNRVGASRRRKNGVGEGVMKYMETVETEVSAWPSVSIHPHRFGGRKFLFGSAEVGQIHTGGTVHIPFPRSVRDALLAGGLAEEH